MASKGEPMTEQELAEIRKRCDEDSFFYRRTDNNRAVDDRRKLLAEVDRLKAELGAERREECRAESDMGLRIIMLTPASIGSEWFAEHCEGRAAVIGLRPRLTFEGCSDPYPKDCMLTIWGPLREGLPLLSTWRWK